VIDWVAVKVPEFTPPGPLLAQPISRLKGCVVPPFRPSRYYQYVCDLREPFDIDAVVHLNFRYGRETHKVEIIDAGEKTLDQMARIISQLFDVDPWGLSVMRTDLAADVEGVPVRWFKDHAYVNRKRYSSRIEKSLESELQFVAMSDATAETLYAGKRPNILRIYDKFGELRVQLRKIEREYRRFNAGLERLEMTEEQRYFGQLIPPTFEHYCELHGYKFEIGKILTRVEHQIGGRIPREFATLRDLQYAHEVDPFTSLKIMPGVQFQSHSAPPSGVPIRDYLAALGLDHLEKDLGSRQLAHQFVYKHANGNGKRLIDSLARCVPAKQQPTTIEQVRESYRRSTLAQTSPSGENRVYLTPTYGHEREIAGSGFGVLS